jgi:hypothetical protein
VNIGYQPHFIYASFGALGNAFANDDIDDSVDLEIEGVEFAIYPTP